MELTQSTSTIYGITAEFQDTDTLIAAARAARDAGYKKMDAYTPMPVEGLSEAIGYRNKQMPALMLIGGLLGCSTGYWMLWFANTQSYPLNLGGRPYHSWPMFIVPTFEMTILFCAFAGVFGMILLNGLPQLYHSMFNAPNFDRASSDAFFLTIEATDPQFDLEKTTEFMRGLNAVQVSEVPI